MLADLLPLMTDSIRHQHAVARDVFGRVQPGDATEHRARVVNSPGKGIGPASREAMPDATATAWLIDHPFPIATGDTFELPTGEHLTVARLERRNFPGGVLSKVYLT